MATVENAAFDIVFTDVDGTLLDAEHRVLAQSCSVIQGLAPLDIPFVLVSARMPEGLYTIQNEIGFTGPLVCYSGAYVLDVQGNELLSKPIALDVALDLKAFLDTELPEVCCSEYGFHTWACDDDTDPRIMNEERITTLKATRAPLSEAFDEQGIHKFLLMGDPDQIAAAQERISTAYSNLTAVRSSETLCEIMRGDVTKSEGVHVLCDYLGVDIERAIAFGDGRNDIDMLRAVPRSYAMANAPAEVKDSAAGVTELSNDQNGLAVQLEQLLGMR